MSADIPPIPPVRFDVPPIPTWSPTASNASGGQLSEERGYLGGVPLASWPRRFAAGLIDYGVPLWLWPNIAISVLGLSVNTTLVGAAVMILVNSVMWQGGYSGSSLGKDVFRICIAYAVNDPDKGATLTEPGIIRCWFRLVLHVVDWFSMIGFFRPLWNSRRQTFADSITGTIVIMADAVELDLMARGPRLL